MFKIFTIEIEQNSVLNITSHINIFFSIKEIYRLLFYQLQKF